MTKSFKRWIEKIQTQAEIDFQERKIFQSTGLGIEDRDKESYNIIFCSQALLQFQFYKHYISNFGHNLEHRSSSKAQVIIEGFCVA